MDSIGAWLVIGIGVYIVWLAWGRKKVRGSGQTARPVLFVPVAGEPARRRSPLLTALLVLALIVGLFMAANWLNGHVPPAPGNPR